MITISQNSEDRNLDDTAETLKLINFNEITAGISQITGHINVVNRAGHLLGAGKEWSFPLLLPHKTTCQSLQVPKQSNLENKRNICDICHTCQNCYDNMSPGLQSFTNSDIVTALTSLKNGCSSFRSDYYLFATRSICCTVQTVETTNNFSSIKQFNPVYLKHLRQMRSLDDLFGDLVAAIIPPGKKPGFGKGHDQEARSLSAKNPRQQAVPTEEYCNSLHTFSCNENNSNSCTATVSVMQFTGAGCYSNRSVNFFLMDSTDNWEVAERLGVRNTCKDKTALVIADLEVKSIGCLVDHHVGVKVLTRYYE